MLSWLFKKRGAVAKPKALPPAPTTAQQPAVLAAQAAQIKSEGQARQREHALALWQPRLQAALGDDAALLHIASATPLLAIKLAAVDALAGEAALRQAEHEFRGHDRRVHRIAKQRLEAAVAQREARLRAEALIETVRVLIEQAQIPVNHLVAIDRDWQALGPALLDPAQRSRFADLRAGLDDALRQRDAQQQHQQRWTLQATRVLATWQHTGTLPATEGEGDNALAALHPLLLALSANRPDAPATALLGRAVDGALQAAAALQAQLAERAELASQTMAETLAAAHRLSVDAPPAVLPQPQPPQPPMRRLQAPLSAEQRQALDALLQQAEIAAAEGQLGALAQQLAAVDALLAALAGLKLPDKLRARRQGLQSEQARLKSWQQWGGERARDDLVDKAEALARLTLAAAPPALPAAPAEPADADGDAGAGAGAGAGATPTGASPAEATPAAKLHLKTHADSLNHLRKRWKELDGLGGAASQALWLRFDAALSTAYQPVAAQQALQSAVRLDNLLARQALLVTLDGLLLPAMAEASASEASAPSPVAADAGAEQVRSTASMIDWKEPLRALNHFHTAWRQLGPLEHTVPHAARSGLQQHWRDSVGRIEAPLQHARQAAEAVRAQLIERAQALVHGGQRQPDARDAGQRMRDLQADWQQHARRLPLARAVENALWARFKAASDAVFAQRDAAFNARDSGLAAHLAVGEALLARLQGLHSAERPASAAQIERTLAEIDRDWRQLGELPRAAAAPVQARFRAAWAAALQRLGAIAAERWQAECDALLARLALCAQREAGATDSPTSSATASPTDSTDLARRWAEAAALPDALPTAWAQALAQRWSGPVDASPNQPAAWALDDLLLQIELALNLPATPDQQAARRQLKLLALKAALEGRAAAPAAALQPAACWAAVLRQPGASPAQHARLQALIGALRQAPPGTLT